MANKILSRLILAIAVATAVAQPLAQSRRFDLLTAGIAEVQAAVAAGGLTYERLVRLYLNRIEAYDKQGPRVNAVLTINPRALDLARALDDERRAKGVRGPLHGIPVAVKDNIDTEDMPTTGGNPVFRGSTPARDAPVVARLRAAGAIIFVKTNLDELALDSKGLSTVGGQTLNPYNLTRSPGGSSSGTAVTIAAAFATVGLATETGLSIRGPAANTGLVAIAPSRGLVSRVGVIPVSFTQDRVGVHARSVADVDTVLQHLRGFDADDLSTAASLGQARDPTDASERDSAAIDPRLGVLTDLFRKGEPFTEANAIVHRQLARLSAAGVTVVPDLTTGQDLVAMMPTLRVNSFELAVAFDAYARRRGGPIASFSDLIATGQYLKGGNLETRVRESREVGRLDDNAEYRKRLAQQQALAARLVDLMDTSRVDALAYPVKSLGAPSLGGSDSGPRDNAISSTTGLPSVVIPAGLTAAGLPLGVELLGRPFSESRLFRLARALERAAGARALPGATPALEGDEFVY